MKVKVCCFDLDGTLLPMELDDFITEYFKALVPYAVHLMPPEQFFLYMGDAMKRMIGDDDPNRTNEEVFMERFLSQSGLEQDKVWPLLERFYEEEFPKLRKYVTPTPVARQVVQAAMEQGMDVIVATNPVFPRAAIEERLRWAGVEDLIKWVTVYEESHFCKPHVQYYREVVGRLGVLPEECVMIGNDMQEDMVAETIGMRTYFLKDCRIDRGEPVYHPNQEGNLNDLLEDIRNQRGVFQ